MASSGMCHLARWKNDEANFIPAQAHPFVPSEVEGLAERSRGTGRAKPRPLRVPLASRLRSKRPLDFGTLPKFILSAAAQPQAEGLGANGVMMY